ncbi:MAG: hypothetical protein WCE72_15685, partial [Pseudolabrys sp.]
CYALDITLDLKGATKSQIDRAMRGHVLANAELIGTYQKGTGSHGTPRINRRQSYICLLRARRNRPY